MVGIRKENTSTTTTMIMVGMEKNKQIFYKNTDTSPTMIMVGMENNETMIMVWKERKTNIFHLPEHS